MDTLSRFIGGAAAVGAIMARRQAAAQSEGSSGSSDVSVQLAGSREEAEAAVREAQAAREASRAAETLTILHFNDVYNIEAGSRNPVGGGARFVGLLKRLQAETKSMVLFSGDAFNPSTMSTSLRGSQMVPILNLCNIHTSVLGNHDFDFGTQRLEKLMSKCNFPWLMANVFHKDDGKPLVGARASRLVCWEGRLVGIVGLVEKEWLQTLSCIDSDNDLEYRDFIAEGRRLAQDLRRQGAEIVIALTHMRQPNDEKLCNEVEEIDLVLGGHDHHYAVKPVGPRGVYMCKSGTDFRQLTRVTIKFGAESPASLSVSAERFDITDDLPEDEEAGAIVSKYKDLVLAKLDKVIGQVHEPLDCRFSKIRSEETNSANWVADLALHCAKADVAILNSGSLRADEIIPRGHPSSLRTLSSCSLCATPSRSSLSGAQILEGLEAGVSQVPRLEGR